MKKNFLLLSLLISFLFVQYSYGQIIVSGTSFSSYRVKKEKTVKTEKDIKLKPKSNRAQGWFIRPEIEMGVEFWDYTFSLGGNLNIGYQLNPFIALGVGGGWNMFYKKDYRYHNNNYHYYYYSRYLRHTYPVYANIRGYFCNRKVSPYYNIKIGYAFSYGLYMDYGLGINWKNFDFGVSTTLVWDGVEYIDKISLLFNFSYNLQFPRKK